MAKPAVLCDLGGSRIRFAVGDPSDPLQIHRVTDWEVRRFDGDRRFQTALSRFLCDTGIDPAERDLMLSLPCEMGLGKFEFDNLHASWSFDETEILAEFAFSEVYARNDAFAAFMGIFPVLAADAGNSALHYEYLVSGEHVEGSAIISLGPGTGLGATGAILNISRDLEGSEKSSADDGLLIPIPTEYGSSLSHCYNDELRHFHRYWESQESDSFLSERNIGVNVTDAFQAVRTRKEFFVSGPGIMRMFEALVEENADLQNSATKPRAIVIAAKRSEGDGIYVRVMQAFCKMLADAVVDLGLSFTARGGIYLYGSILNEIGAGGLEQFGFLQRIEERQADNRYPNGVPIVLIKHPYLELIGLNRYIEK